MSYVITSMDSSIVGYEITITIESPAENGFVVKKETRQVAVTGGLGMTSATFDVPVNQITQVEIACDRVSQW